MELIKSIPAGANPYGWTEQNLYYDEKEGYVVAMVVNNSRQNTIDPTTVVHISKEYADNWVNTAEAED